MKAKSKSMQPKSKQEHQDVKQDRKMVKKMVKKTCLTGK